MKDWAELTAGRTARTDITIAEDGSYRMKLLTELLAEFSCRKAEALGSALARQSPKSPKPIQPAKLTGGHT